jgi:hypothetical protein
MSTSNVTANAADYLAVVDLINRYTDAINRRDWSALEQVFNQDGIWDVGGPEAAPFSFLFAGRDKVVEGIRGLIAGLEFLVQTNHALVVNIVGDRATSSSTLHEDSGQHGSTEGMRVMGMYSDEIVRDDDGEWRFAKRTFRFIYIETVTRAGQILRVFPRDA